MNKQELINKLTNLAKDFKKEADYCAEIYDDGASAYRECWSKLDDLIEEIKQTEQAKSPVVENEQLFDKVQELMQQYCWLDFKCGVDCLKFTNCDFEESSSFAVYRNQHHVLRSLLNYFLNEDNDIDIDEQLWVKFLIAYKLENCDV